MSMDAIRESIDQTVVNLREKRQLLVNHKAQYNDLKFKLMDFQQYKETDKPEIDVKLNSKAIVKGQIINPQKILVFLGCEYFVERDPSKAIKLVENKLKVLNKAINDFDTKIKDAKKTIENIGHLEEFERKKQKNTTTKPSKIDAKVEEITQDEEFPFMDIREELDEEGNIIKSSVQKQDDSRINGFAEKPPINGNGEINDYEDQIAELLEDMDIKPKPKIEEIPEEKTTEPKIVDVKDVEKKDEAVSTIIKENDVISPKDESNYVKETAPEPEPKDEYYQLMRDMGISTKPKSGISKKDESKVEKHKSEPVVSDIVETTTEEPIQPVIEVNGEWGDFDPDQPAIEQDDIMQLQLIADQFEEDGDFEYDDEDFEFDEEGDENEDQDEDEDWDFSTNPDSLIPDSHRNLFMKELQRVRNEKNKPDQPVNTNDEPVDTKDKSKKKKSVSFAPELQIKEIENVAEELKNAPDHAKLSKFKQMRISNSVQPKPFITEIPTNDDDDVKERPVSDMVVEKEVTEEQSVVHSDIIEKEQSSEPNPEPVTKRVSKFKQRSLGNVSESFVSSESGSPIVDSPVSDIVDKDAEESEPLPVKKVSKFKQRNLNSVSSPELTGTAPLSDIVEKDVISEVHEEAQPQEKVSKFKSLSQKQAKGNVISIPKNEIEYDPDQDFNDIKIYIENDEEDEELLNAITDMDIYTTAELDGSDSDDLEADQPEDEGGVLTDQIVEHDEVEDPNYFVDDNILQKEYNDLKRKMFAKYLERGDTETKERIIRKNGDEGEEFEPIDKHGNPLKASRFMESLGKGI